jgi:hypothetical protein
MDLHLIWRDDLRGLCSLKAGAGVVPSPRGQRIRKLPVRLEQLEI